MFGTGRTDMSIQIRAVTTSDAEAISGIYSHYVIETPITFEVDPPDAAAFRERIEARANYPWLIACQDNVCVGYAYASRHRARAAYRFSVETSVYLRTDQRGRGVGRQLYEALFDMLATTEFCNAYAGVTLPNGASIRLHEAMGFQRIGVFPRVGFKFDAWHDVAWFHRAC